MHEENPWVGGSQGRAVGRVGGRLSKRPGGLRSEVSHSTRSLGALPRRPRAGGGAGGAEKRSQKSEGMSPRDDLRRDEGVTEAVASRGLVLTRE